MTSARTRRRPACCFPRHHRGGRGRAGRARAAARGRPGDGGQLRKPAAAADAVATLTGRLFPLATVVTPNLPEAQALTGLDTEDRRALAERLVAHGRRRRARHRRARRRAGGPPLRRARATCASRVPRHAVAATHGAGCTHSAALAAALAAGLPLARRGPPGRRRGGRRGRARPCPPWRRRRPGARAARPERPRLPPLASVAPELVFSRPPVPPLTVATIRKPIRETGAQAWRLDRAGQGEHLAPGREVRDRTGKALLRHLGSRRAGVRPDRPVAGNPRGLGAGLGAVRRDRDARDDRSGPVRRAPGSSCPG